MSRYYYLIFLIYTLLSIGCSIKHDNQVPNSTKVLDSNLTANFPKEDELLIFALDAQNHGEFKEAAKFYSKLYELTSKSIYATEAIKNYVLIKDYDYIKKILDMAEANNHHNATLDSYLVAYYIDKKRFNEAKELTDNLLKEDRSIKNLELSGLVYEGLGEDQKALNYYEESYRKSKSEYALLKMTDLIFFKMKQKSKAIRILETHTLIEGCSKTICGRLLQLYADIEDRRGIANILKKLYKESKNPIYAQRLVELYASQRDYNQAIAFLKESKFDDLLLLDIYTSKKDYKSALKLSEKIYKESGNPELLARSAILEYESSKNKNSKKLLKRVSDKFDKVIDILDDPLYYNYYGYLLIDHEIDVDRGIELVKKALKVEPDSTFYIDSLAWGIYKKGECKKAKEIIEKISKEDRDQEEIKDHIKIINRCIEGDK